MGETGDPLFGLLVFGIKGLYEGACLRQTEDPLPGPTRHFPSVRQIARLSAGWRSPCRQQGA